jgi:cytochrome c-type biogenesis protein CcmE
MSRTDEELARALDDAPEPPRVSRPAAPEPAQSSGPKRRNLGLLAALVVIAAAIGALVLVSFKDAAVYAKTVDQLLASRDKMVGRAVRVEGSLVHGSLLKRDSPCEYRFQITRNGATLPVRYPQCVVPDTFRDRPEADVAVTAEGKLMRDGTFEATQIMAKCPSKYEEKEGRKVPVGMAAQPGQ